MRKLTSIIAIAMMSLSASFAQTPVATKTKQTVKSAQVATKVEVKKSVNNAANVKVTAPVAVKKVAVAAGPTKKDGTADMRYKANKVSKVAGPTKKDGTADMRYKANKTTKKPK